MGAVAQALKDVAARRGRRNRAPAHNEAAALGSVIGFSAYALLLGILWGAAAFAWSARRVCKARVRQ